MSDKLFRCMSVQNCSESSGQNCICLNCSQMFYLLEREEDFEGMCVLGWGGRSFLMLKYFSYHSWKRYFTSFTCPQVVSFFSRTQCWQKSSAQTPGLQSRHQQAWTRDVDMKHWLNVWRRLNLSFVRTVTQHLSVQLAVGLPDRETSGSTGRQ